MSAKRKAKAPAGGRPYEELLRRVRAFRDAREWKRFHNPKDLAISITLEAAELLEHFQWKAGRIPLASLPTAPVR